MPIKDYHAEGRKITAVIFVGIAVAFGVYTYWSRETPPEKAAFTPQEKACLDDAGAMLTKILLTQSDQNAAAMNEIIARFVESKSQPEYDLAMAQLELKRKYVSVALNTSYCNEYAKCLPRQPFKETFDGCYSVFREQADNSN